ncbi:multicopper oxidase domain-containing protein [Kibdelosporangium aridum]|nr:multicopper oxidase domain-containing protein [Kibdelosporangium aridum]
MTHRSMRLYAEALPGDKFGYGLLPGKATIPGPTIEMMEGETLSIELVNNAGRPLSLHTHGVDYDVASDGTPMNGGVVQPGERRIYVWNSHRPFRRADGTLDGGSAGYWPYHDHALGGEHGSEGVAKGLYGALVVRRRDDLLPDKQFVVVMNDESINTLVAPDTPTFRARKGERVEWIVIGMDSFPHTFHLHGHRWSDTRTGYPSGPDESAPLIDTKDVLAAVSFGFQLIAGEHSGPGKFFYRDARSRGANAGINGVYIVE